MQKKQTGSNQKPRILKNKKDINPSTIPPHILEMLETPSISEIEAPEGFRAVSFSHAMMEYAKPVMEFQEKGVVKELNAAFGIASLIWNYSISLETEDSRVNYDDLLLEVSKTLKMTKKKSIEFIDSMIQRKHTLLPSDIQPENARIMFIKKEKHFLVTEFNYSSLSVSDTILPIDNEDRTLVEMINRMDKNIKYDTEYSKWENYYFKIEKLCKLRFEKWMKGKGIENHIDNFSFNVEIFLNFVYRYAHGEKIYLKSITPIYFEEFFCDHILRKVMLEPHEYTQFPPAIKTFYKFLSEKQYLKNEESIINIIDEIEPRLLDILKKRFS